MKKVAIVGMGISGMGVLNAYYKENQKDQITIDCYDSEESFARGYPYGEDTDDALLNVRPPIVAFDFENTHAFGGWLKENDISYTEYVPRYIYGRFLKEKTKQVIEEMKASIILEQVIDMEYLEQEEKWILATVKGEKKYDRVHLCCGKLPSRDFYNLKEQKKHINDIYPLEGNLKRIQDGASVGIIGTSLSAIDVMRYLLKNKNVKKLHVFSRRNIFPTIRKKDLDLTLELFTQENIQSITDKQNGWIYFSQVDALIEKEFKLQGIDRKDLLDRYDHGFKSLEESLKEDKALEVAQSLPLALPFNQVWYAMSKTDKESFFEKYKKYLDLFGGPTPEETGRLLVEKYKQGYIEVIDGIYDINFDHSKNKFSIINKKDDDLRTAAQVDWMVNATGLDNYLVSLDQDSLLAKLMNKEIIEGYTYGGITVLPSCHQVLSPRYGELKTLFAHGVLITGVELINNGAKLIQRSTNEIVKKIL